MLIKDIDPGSGRGNVHTLTVIGSRLFFSATDGASGQELWTSDGTATIRVADINPGSSSNTVNVSSNGTIAVSILTTAVFDAATVDASTVDFAGANAFQYALEDVDGDGDLDMVLHFRTEDTMLADIYADLLVKDADGDGIIDNTSQVAEVSLAAALVDESLIEGFDSMDLFLRGRALRDLLEVLASTGAI